MLVPDKTVETSTISNVNDPLVEFGHFLPEHAAAIRRTVQLIMRQVRTQEISIFTRQPDGRLRLDLRNVMSAIRRLPPEVQAKAERDAQCLGLDLNVWFLGIALMAVFAFDAESIGIDANTFFDAIKPIPKIGRRYAMSPVTEYIARRALSLRETTDLTWADIAEKIVVELREKEHPTEVERNVIKRLSDAISTNDRKFIGTVVSQTIVALKKHSLP